MGERLPKTSTRASDTMKKVLLTGSGGFLGQNIVEHFQGKYGVIGVRSKDYDLRDQDACKRLLADARPDVVVHAAGTVGGIGANRDNPGKFMYENLIMGTNLIHQAMLDKVGKFVLLGTVCAYPKWTEVPFKEEDLWNGYPEETNAPYGIAKKALIKLVETYHEQYGMNGVNLIPVNMYGPYDHFDLVNSHVIPALINKVHNAKVNNLPSIGVWGDGSASREFLYARDCADAIDLAIQNHNSPEPVNVGTGNEITIKELVSTIMDVVGYEGEVVYDTSKPNGQMRRCLDTCKAKERFGFEAKTPFAEGLRATYGWYLSTL
jgi:GDP-L-fucose synthase